MKKRQSSRIADRNNKKQRTQSLIEAVKNKASLDEIQRIVDLGAALEEVAEGKTALMHAVINNNVEVAKLLISKGADVRAREFNGSTVLMHAVSRMSDTYFIETLIQNGGTNVSLKNKQQYTALLLACENGGPEVVKTLLKHGANVSDTNKFGNTSLMLAARRNSLEIVKILLSAGADIEAKNIEGETALFRCRNEESLTVLLKAGANPQAVSTNKTPVIIKIAKTNTHNLAGCIAQLFKAGVKPSTQDKLGNSVLMCVCDQHDEQIESVKLLLSKGANPSCKNVGGRYPLWSAISSGHFEIVKLLLDAGANPSGQDEAKYRYCKSLLVRVCEGAKENSIYFKLLIQEGANISAEDYSGKTAIMYAVEGRQTEFVKDLLEAGANPSQEDKFGKSALHRALSMVPRDVELTQVIIDASVAGVLNLDDRISILKTAVTNRCEDVIDKLLNHNINAQDSHGENMLMKTCKLDEERVDLVEVLIRHGSALSFQNKNGETALMIALEKGYLLIVETLIKSGAKIATQANSGTTLLMMASEKGLLEVVQLLLRYNAPTSITNEFGETAAILAASKNHLDVVCVLLEHGCSVVHKDNKGLKGRGNSVLSHIVRNRIRGKIHPDFELSLRYIIDYGTQVDEVAIVPEVVRVYLMNCHEITLILLKEFIKQIVEKATNMINDSTLIVQHQLNVHKMLMDDSADCGMLLNCFEYTSELFYILIESPFKNLTWTQSMSMPLGSSCFSEMLSGSICIPCDTMGYLIDQFYSEDNYAMNKNIYKFLCTLIDNLIAGGFSVRLNDPNIISPLSVLTAFYNYDNLEKETYVLKLAKKLLKHGAKKCQHLIRFEEIPLEELRQQLHLPDSLWLAFQSGYSSVLPLLVPYWSAPPLSLFMFVPSLTSLNSLTYYTPADHNFELTNFQAALESALDVLVDISGPLPPGHQFIQTIQNYFDGFAEQFEPARSLSEKFRKLHTVDGPPSLRQLCRHVIRVCEQTGEDLPERLIISPRVPFGLRAFLTLQE